MTFTRLLTFALLLGGLCSTSLADNGSDLATSAEARPIIRVLTKDGRRLSGRIARDSNSEQLRLVLGTPNIIVSTRIATSNIQSIITPTGELSCSELLDRLSSFRLKNDWHLSPHSGPIATTVHSRPQAHSTTPTNPTNTSQRTIAAISVTARLVNWDRDEALDGLLLELIPLDELGHPVLASGQLDVELFGQHWPVSGGSSSADDQRRPVTPSLESWHVSVVGSGSEDVVTVKLPFRRFDPERSPDIALVGLLRVRFGVPTVGVFEASVSDVIIREPSLFRDELFLSTGNRLLPSERP